MISLTRLSKIIGGVESNLFAPSARKIVFDSREVEPGVIFWAIKGKKLDGNKFADAAVKAGAAAVVTSDLSFAGPSVIVDDTYRALIKYAAQLRAEFTGKVIAVTGSTGKTTARHYITAVLAKHGNVLTPVKNFNNEFGVPITMLNLNNEYDYFVAELGGSHLGEISFLSNLVKPDIAIITNIGNTHLEFLGTMENVFRMKMEILDGVKEGAALFVPREDDFLKRLPKEIAGTPVYKCSITDAAGSDYYLRNTNNSMDIFRGQRLFAKLRSNEVWNIAVNKYALILALSAADKIGLDVSKVELSDFKPIPGRFEMVKIGNSVLINDAYNSNLEALIFGLRRLLALAPLLNKNKIMLILGDMYELGANSEDIHKKAEKYISYVKADTVVLIGDYMTQLKSGAKKEIRLPTAASVKTLIDGFIEEQAIIYCKASNGTGLFDVLNNYFEEKHALSFALPVTQ